MTNNLVEKKWNLTTTNLNDLLAEGKYDEYVALMNPESLGVYKALYYADEIHHIPILKHMGLTHHRTCADIAASSTVEVMEYALRNDCEMSVYATNDVVGFNDTHMLQCLLNHGCPLTRWALWLLNNREDQSMIEFIDQNNPLNSVRMLFDIDLTWCLDIVDYKFKGDKTIDSV